MCRYTDAVRSVADDLRDLTHARVRAMPAAARVALALALGDADLDLFARFNGLPLSDARGHLQTRRARGRIPSPAAAREPSR